jgi:hypothetical protein
MEYYEYMWKQIMHAGMKYLLIHISTIVGNVIREQKYLKEILE